MCFNVSSLQQSLRDPTEVLKHTAYALWMEIKVVHPKFKNIRTKLQLLSVLKYECVCVTRSLEDLGLFACFILHGNLDGTQFGQTSNVWQTGGIISGACE